MGGGGSLTSRSAMALHGLPPVLQGAEQPRVLWRSADANSNRGKSEKNRREERMVQGVATIASFNALVPS